MAFDGQDDDIRSAVPWPVSPPGPSSPGGAPSHQRGTVGGIGGCGIPGIGGCGIPGIVIGGAP